jgi:putative Mg2+ transporter-C (MgtC) family protein
MTSDLDAVLRLVVATIVGLAIGFNRQITDKPIGMRTLALVALGAAVAALAAINFDGIASAPQPLARVIQGILEGVLAGIGFIGAGVVLHQPRAHTVYGLTTAATVWVTAALGIACALAAWTVVAAGLVLALAILFGLDWLERRLLPRRSR